MENVNGFARFTLSFAIPHFCHFSEPRGVKNSAIRKEKPLKFIENPSRCLLKGKYRNNADILVLETFSVVLNLMGHNLKTKKSYLILISDLLLQMVVVIFNIIPIYLDNSKL